MTTLLVIITVETTIILLLIMKLSELPAAVAALNTKADTINTKLDAFLPTVGDPNLPPDAEAGLTQLSDKLVAIDVKIPPPA